MKKIVVLGAGLVGKAIAIDLSTSFDVTSVDIYESNLEKFQNFKHIKTQVADLSDPDELLEVVKDCDLVIGALPGFMGFEAVKQTITAGKDIIDISHSRSSTCINNSCYILFLC